MIGFVVGVVCGGCLGYYFADQIENARDYIRLRKWRW